VSLFLAQLFNGLDNGVVYASVALALVLIFRTTGVLNFAQGEIALFFTYVTYQLTHNLGWPIVAAIAGSMALAFVTGGLIERLLIRPVEKASPLTIVIVTLGMFLAINSLAQLIYGTKERQLPSAFPHKSWHIAGTALTATTVGLVGVLAVECLLLYLLLQKTRIGLALRAVANNPDSSRLVGINTGRMLMFGWALAAALSALAGAMVVPTQPALVASSLQSVLVLSFAAAALGGFDSPLGAVVGGLIVGVADAMTHQYIGPLKQIELVLPFGIILLVLLFRPNGLFGRSVVERV
jgi:branched-chain amino acid transport system permease protein